MGTEIPPQQSSQEPQLGIHSKDYTENPTTAQKERQSDRRQRVFQPIVQPGADTASGAERRKRACGRQGWPVLGQRGRANNQEQPAQRAQRPQKPAAPKNQVE